jgi:hypothetical protein
VTFGRIHTRTVRVIAPLRTPSRRNFVKSTKQSNYADDIGGDFVEVARADLEKPAAKHDAPIFLRADEIERLNERMNRCFKACFELHLPAPSTVSLKRCLVENGPDRGESLQRHAVGIIGARRIEHDTVAFREPLQRRRPAVIGLCESAFHAALHVRFRNGVDPVTHA